MRWGPAVLAALAYASATGNGFVWDDVAVVDFQLDRFASLADVFAPPPDIVRWSYEYYRPVVVLSWLLDARLFGAGAPAGAHAMNVAMHVGATYFTGRLALRLLAGLPGAASGAALGAALFAVHPIHVESVSWIAGRSDVLAALFLLPALLCVLAARDAPPRRAAVALVGGGVLFLLALLSKESALTGLAVLPLVLALAPGKIAAEADPARGAEAAGVRGVEIAAVAVFVAGALAYFWMRGRAEAAPGVTGDFGRLRDAGALVRATGYYLVKLAWPWPQSNLAGWGQAPGLAAAAAVVLAAAAGSAAAWRRWRRGGHPAPLAAAGWFWATVSAPVWIAASGATNTPLAERYLYIPSVAPALLGGALAGPVLAGPRRGAVAAVAAVAALVLGAYAAGTWTRGLAWRDDVALWTDATRHADAPGLAWTNLGLNLMKRGRDAEAAVALARAREDPQLDPRWLARVENGLGTLRLRAGEPDAAEAHFRAAARAQAEYHEPWYGLGNVEHRRAQAAQAAGDHAARDAAVDRAAAAYAAGLSRNALYHPARVALAELMAEHGDWLAADGEAARAARRWQAGAGQLDDMLALIPPARRDYALGRLRDETGADPLALRERLARAVAQSLAAP